MPPSDPPAAVVRASGLARRYGATRALGGVDLTLGAGESLLVVGPNGAGKTTLLRVLAGLLKPAAGSLEVLGRRVRADDPESRRPIGFVSHRSLLYDDLTLLENLAFAARLYALDRPLERARAALAGMGLGSRADDSPRRLSRGMLQRAAIARAFLAEPQLLLLDEPFTGLDAAAADLLRADLAARRSAGAALVIVTHQPAEAWELATDVAALVGGRWALREARPTVSADFLARYAALAEPARG
jgi:heme ABC exporter ATP-binding subunit CcmA